MKKVKLLKRRVLAISMALAMMLSSLVVSQGVITAYAEDESNDDIETPPGEDDNGTTPGEGDTTTSSAVTSPSAVTNPPAVTSPPALVATTADVSSNKATQIKNGDFEDIPWIDYVYNGVTYTNATCDKSLGSDKKITSSIRKGVDEGWNTTEINPYNGNLFEVWPTGSPLDKNEPQKGSTERNGKYYIEMNTTNPACLYQDLATQGGDVIKWTLQHAARNKHGFNEQRMYVTIGSPEIGTDGAIVPATGIGEVSGGAIVDNIKTNIKDLGKAEYRYNGIAVGSGSAAFVKSVNDLSGLSVKKTDTEWHTVTGIYVVPQGQDITRFAFCADALSKTDSDNINHLSGGNFLDNITFSTLIGSLKATEQSDKSVKVTGYWGDTDSSKHLVIEIGEGASANEYLIDMKDVCGKNFDITVPKEIIGDTRPSDIKVYHENYKSATKTVPITHEHTWNYKTVENESNKIYAYCSKTEGEGSGTHDCTYKESANNVYLTLTAPDAVYTGEAYKEGRVSNWSITDISLATKPAITYYRLDGDVEEKTSAGNSGAASDGAAPKYAGNYRAKITIANATGSQPSEVTATQAFTISKLPIDTVAFTEPTTTSGCAPATELNTADNAFYTGSISWTPSDGTFAYNRTYTATVTLTLKDENKKGCIFASSVKCPSGWSATSENDKVVLTREYKIKPKITSVTVPTVETQLQDFTTQADQLAALPLTVAVTVESGDKTAMKIDWKLKDKTIYSTGSQAENTFVWTIKSSEYTGYDTTGQTLNGEIKIKNPSHTTHSWIYGGQEKQLSAYCALSSEPGCIYDSEHKLTLTLSASDMTYTGSTYTGASIATEGQSAWTAAGLERPTIKYEGDTGTDYLLSDTAPTAVGNYKAVISMGGQRAEAAFQITSSGSGSGGGSGSGSSSGSGGSSSGGAGGTQPTAPTENFDIPVKNENTVKVEAEIKDGTANVSEITNKTIEKVVNNKDAESKVDTITIDLSGAKQEVTGVTLSKESVKTLAETTAQKDNGIDTATIELSKATVELDHKALETLAEQAKGTQIQLVVEDKDRRELNSAQQATLDQHQVATTFEAYFTSDGQRIHDFKGGKAVVSIDFTPEAGKDTSYYHMVYVAESGDMTRYKTKYENRKLMFTTTHFSDYAVIYDTGEKNETEKTEEEKKDNGSGTDGKVTMDTSYSRLRLRIPTSTKTTNVLKWTKQTGADGYVIYGNHCNTGEKKYKMVQRVVIKDGSTTTWVDKNLDGGTYYKYYIKAYKLVNGKKVWLAKSKVVHSTTTGGKYGNAKTVKVNQTVLSLTKGKTFAIKAEQVIKDKPIDEHQDIKYESSNTKVASVTGKGVIKAKKKGTCYIYVYAQNGMYRRIKVTVK